ncbi:MAG: galactosyltransferase-related protein [Trueperaceae bacterium]|nr:galactosyltransferase-related protein [Trueperaceae bacterium]
MSDGPGAARPELSVVTASRGRIDALRLKAESLRDQTLSPDRFEWRIWLNETPEETARQRASLERAALPFALHVSGGSDQPVGRARNLAAAHSRADVLLLSDDDCTHDPTALAAHLTLHATVRTAVGVGTLRLPGELRTGGRREPFERTWTTFGRAHWMNATGANTSVPRALFEAVGGYDPAWTGYGGEDPELALRLRDAGAVFRHVPGGGAQHHGRVWDDSGKAYWAGRAHRRLARRRADAATAWWLGVHPVLLAAKRIWWAGPWTRWIDADVVAYERAYARGARDEARNSDDARGAADAPSSGDPRGEIDSEKETP